MTISVALALTGSVVGVIALFAVMFSYIEEKPLSLLMRSAGGLSIGLFVAAIWSAVSS